MRYWLRIEQGMTDMQITYTVTAGDFYYPEMGGSHDGTAIFTIRNGGSLSWQPERHAEALAMFKQLRIRPSRMELITTIYNGQKWMAGATWDAVQKLRAAKAAVSEMLLD